MALVDIEEKYYPCPHCDGFIRLRVQYPHDDLGCSISVYHVIKHKGMDEELNLEEQYELHEAGHTTNIPSGGFGPK